jgi:hypothetical protein
MHRLHLPSGCSNPDATPQPETRCRSSVFPRTRRRATLSAPRQRRSTSCAPSPTSSSPKPPADGAFSAVRSGGRADTDPPRRPPLCSLDEVDYGLAVVHGRWALNLLPSQGFLCGCGIVLNGAWHRLYRPYPCRAPAAHCPARRHHQYPRTRARTCASKPHTRSLVAAGAGMPARCSGQEDSSHNW